MEVIDADAINRQDAIRTVASAIWHYPRPSLLNNYHFAYELAEDALKRLPSAEPNDKLKKIADLVDGTIDHFDLDDAMDLLYQIKDVCEKEMR